MSDTEIIIAMGVAALAVLGFCLTIEDIIIWIEMRKTMLKNDIVSNETAYRAWRQR